MNSDKNPRWKTYQYLGKILMQDLSESAIDILLRSVPLIGTDLASNQKILRRLSAIFESDDRIQRDINSVVDNMNETEAILTRLEVHVNNRKADLEKTLEEYNRYKQLSAVEEEKARPILNELKREGNKGLIWGAAINLIVLVLGIIIGHYLKVWFPNF